MSKEDKKIIHRKFEGVVTSDKADKTIAVSVTRTKMDPKYAKRYVVTKKYQVHDPENEYKIGDKVIFIETRPISKSKRWRVISKKVKKV